MRHRHGYRKLGRTSAHRAALLKNLSIALIEHGKIETTAIKAKELRSYVEKLITVATQNDSNAHRAVFAALQSKEATKTLVNEWIHKNHTYKNSSWRCYYNGIYRVSII